MTTKREPKRVAPPTGHALQRHAEPTFETFRLQPIARLPEDDPRAIAFCEAMLADVLDAANRAAAVARQLVRSSRLLETIPQPAPPVVPEGVARCLGCAGAGIALGVCADCGGTGGQRDGVR